MQVRAHLAARRHGAQSEPRVDRADVPADEARSPQAADPAGERRRLGQLDVAGGLDVVHA
jgi:hypothetical protein